MVFANIIRELNSEGEDMKEFRQFDRLDRNLFEEVLKWYRQLACLAILLYNTFTI